LRRLLLTEELLGLPGLVRELVEAQRRTEERVGGVEERVSRIEEYIAALADAQRRTEERVGRVEEQIAALAEAQRRTEERVGRVEERVSQLEERVGRIEGYIAALAEAQHRTEERVSRIEENVAALAEAQRQTQENVAALAEAQHQMQENVAALAEAQRQTQENVTALAEAQRQTQEQVQKLASTVSLLAEQVRSLVEAQKHTDDTVGSLKGRMLELTYQNKAAAYFGPLLRRPRVVDLGALLETLEAHLSPEEFRDVLQLDLLVSGKPRLPSEAPEVFLAVEISSVIDERDIERALRRSALLRRAGFRVIPVVAGERATLGAEDEARTHHVVMLQDGRTFLWTEALHTWGAL
jgi:predicted nuclease with TOPRIM domain